jgi:lysophospholipase L1-like esterase
MRAGFALGLGAMALAAGLAAGAGAVRAETARAAKPAWVPTWTASPAPAPAPYAVIQNRTLRQIVHTSAGGKLVRIRFSNAYGATPLHIDDVTIALRDKADAIRPGSSAEVRFQGEKGVTIAPGAFVESDPLPYDVPSQSDLAISYYVAGPAEASTYHFAQRNAVYFAEGDVTGAPSVTPVAAPSTGDGIFWLDEVEVAGSKATTAVVAFGDSITDRGGTPADANAAWPDYFYDRLRKAGVETIAVSNAGLAGDRLLHNGSWVQFGVTGLARFDADVLAQPNVKAVFILIGINDIGQVPHFAPATEHVSPEEIERGLAQLAERAHEKGLKIYVGTLTPFRDTTISTYFSDEKEADRQAVNRWIRASKLFDGVVDLDKALEDPAHPGKMLPLYDSGDHLHPSAEGDKAIADAIPLAWFR